MVQKVPQGYVFARSPFNIYLNDLLYLNDPTEVCNFADDNTFFACDKDPNSLIKRLEHDSLLAIEWFPNNNAICWYLLINMKMSGLKLEMK